MDNLVKRVLPVLAIIGTLYHLYLVVHPYTPLARMHISVLDLTQVQRATHVFLIALLGYLFSYLRIPARSRLGALPLVLMTLAILVQFLQLDLPPALKLMAVLIWACTILPALLKSTLKWSNLACALLAFLPFIYLVVNYEQLIYRAIMPEPWDLVMSFAEVLLILGVIYRLSGPIMPTVVMIFLLYNLYGNYIPGLFGNPGFDFDMLLGKMYCETEAGIFGTVTGVSVKYLIYFTIMGAIVTRLNFGRIIANIALLFVGRSPASPGRACSAMAVLMGMFSGSGAADTQFVATLTRPLFEKVGYDRLVAAGVIATVGSIAYITPPVLGSISFIMVELLSIPYTSIIVMAIGPMLLYLTGILTYNELYVRRRKLKPLELESMVDFSYFKRYCYVFIPIIFIIYMIYKGYSISITVSSAAMLYVLFAYLDPANRPPLANLAGALAEGIMHLLPIASAVIAANMIMSMMVMSGLASKFSILLMQISGSSLLLAVLFTGFFSLLLGMGVPPIATYVLTSALTASTIQQLAMLNGIPENAALLATHMFLFYFAVLAEVTPPVALSAYASASVMGTDPIRTGVFAARVALPKYMIGLTLILSLSGTSLLIVPILEAVPPATAAAHIVFTFLFTLAGIFYLNISVVGYFRANLSQVQRIVIGICAVMLFYPSYLLSVIAVIVSTPLLISNALKRRTAAAVPGGS